MCHQVIFTLSTVIHPLDEVTDACKVLIERCVKQILFVETDLEWYVLDDAVDGSTWYACESSEAELDQYPELAESRIVNTVITTTAKVNELLGTVTEPVLW